MATLRALLDENVREAAPELVESLDRNRVRCFSCGHCCPIPEGQPGVCKVRVSTYNEPLITSEWAVAIFKEARSRGLITGFVSNGNGTPQVLEYLRPWIDLYKVDLKSFDYRHYRQLGGRIAPILETIRSLHQMVVWLHVHY